MDAEFDYEEEIEKLNLEKDELIEKIEWYAESMQEMDDAQFLLQLKKDNKEKELQHKTLTKTIVELEAKNVELMESLKESKEKRRQSIHYLSDAMMQKLLDAETDSQEHIENYKIIIRNLESRLSDEHQSNENIDKNRRKSLTNMSTNMFGKLLGVQQEMKDAKEMYLERIRKLEQQLSLEQLKYETIDIPHTIQKSEIQELNFTIEELKIGKVNASEIRMEMENKLFEAQEKHDRNIEQWKRKYNILAKENEFAIVSKLNMIQECNKEMNLLRKVLRAYAIKEKYASKSWFWST